MLHVCPPDQLGSEVEVLPGRLLEVQHERVVADLQVVLIGVEDDGLLRVELLHHLHGDAVDGGLEVGLLGVNHHADVEVLGGLERG